MRRLILIALATGLLGVAPAQAATCKRPDTTTLAANGVARVFERDGSGSFDRRLYGCLRSHGRAIRLEDAYDDGYVTSYAYANVRLAGRFAAWSFETYDISCKADCPP